MNKAQLKEAVCKAIDARFEDVEKLAMDIFAEPELGFKEQKTSAKVKAAFEASKQTSNVVILSSLENLISSDLTSTSSILGTVFSSDR